MLSFYDSHAGLCAELLHKEKESITKSDPMSILLLENIRQMCCVNLYLYYGKEEEIKL
jgi:hypothetical protein